MSGACGANNQYSCVFEEREGTGLAELAERTNQYSCVFEEREGTGLAELAERIIDVDTATI
jgi:hypothetical protein